MSNFLPGIELSRRYYLELVRPALDKRFSNLPYAAAHLGPGSDVLGFDTPMSTDHDWGPSIYILLPESEHALTLVIKDELCGAMPRRFCGFPVDPKRVHVTTVRSYFWDRLSYDINTPLDPVDWLTFPSQRLREVTSGAIHEDRSGEISSLRHRFAYYPHDIWVYLLAATWKRISQEEHLVLRAGYVGDDLGSYVIGAHLVRDVMNLCFLMQRTYPPYAKWFGTAFQQLNCCSILAPILSRIQFAENWKAREQALCEAYVQMAKMHNSLRITERMSEDTSPFHNRPFEVIHGERFVQALLPTISDPEVQRIASRPLIGGIDQFSDNTDMREHYLMSVDSTSWRILLKRLYIESP